VAKAVDRLVLVPDRDLRAELRRVQEVLRDSRDDACTPLLGSSQSADTIGDEEQKSPRLGFLRADSFADARRVNVERPVQTRDEKVIGVRAADEARMREAKDIHLSERWALER